MKIVTKIAAAALGAVVVGAGGYGLSAANADGPSGPNSSTALRAAQTRTLAAVVPAKPDSVYVALSNCRIVDTATAGGRIPNGSTRVFQATGTVGFSTQGGHAGGCGVPDYATAVSARLTATGELAAGAFVAYPTGRPTGQGTLYYAKAANVTTGVNLQVSPTGAISIKDVGGPAYTIVDVNGYFAPQIHAVLNYNGGVRSGTPQVLSSTHVSTGSYQVSIGRDLTGCTPIASIFGGAFIASASISGNTVYAGTYTTSGTAVDLYWTLTVLC